MTLRLLVAAAAAVALAGCDDNTRRYALDATPTESAVKVRARVASVLVRAVSLPTYAAAEEIAFQDASGVIKLNKSDLWADEPERATTLLTSRHLNQMTSATVAPQPWPLEETPQATVDIRVEQLVATNRNTLRLSGQYFIGGQEIESYDTDEARPKVARRTIRSRSELFDIEVPLLSAGPSAGQVQG
ncbi:PqiC family protein [Pseudophaeobacter leonis]|uniref:PqiC family protein n=1 Tax=Pseudophaeobacter leonis TaxID=1144477 RepID=UPI0009F6AE48|nr:ABC-type transport auxiliary lipoprotein family protein [Pseudophaeobacter leonis]